MEYARYAYVWTLNNYTEEELDKLRICVGKRGIKYICWGKEVAPSTGTPHLQGYVQGTQKQWSRLKEAMVHRIANFEPAKSPAGPFPKELEGEFGKPYSAIGYCMKDGQFEEYGVKMPHKGSPGQGNRADLSHVQEAINEGKTYDDICDEHFGTAAKYHKFIKERIQERDSSKHLVSLRERLESATLRRWQRELHAALQEEPDDRKIKWLWEATGLVGKSWMATYLMVMNDALVLEAGKKVDLAHIFSKYQKKIVIFDLSRTGESVTEAERTHFLNGVYSMAEQLKNGRMISPKFDGKPLCFPVPHVIFFANFEPDYSKWSADRYDVKEL